MAKNIEREGKKEAKRETNTERVERRFCPSHQLSVIADYELFVCEYQ